MLFPDYLKRGDRIRIISPAGKVAKDKVLSGIELLQDEGFEVVIGRHVFDRHFQYSATDQQRAADFQEAINDAETKAIVCARGGYGSARLLNNLDFSPMLQNPKWLVGFSDITVFHLVLNWMEIASIHGVMPAFFLENKKPSKSFFSLIKIMLSGVSEIEAIPNTLNRKGIASGQLIGGNLSLIYSLQGTPWQIDAAGKILLIEDLSEYLYHIDRMMQNLKLSGTLSQLAGLVVGGFTEMQDNESPFGKSAYEIIHDAVKEYSYPVLFDIPVGHIPKNLSVILGANYQLEVGNTCHLKRILP